MKFMNGDRVRMKYCDVYVHGEVTVVKDTECKVLFDEEWAPGYWYYPIADLELIEAEDKKEKS
jgi:hypothetical protein